VNPKRAPAVNLADNLGSKLGIKFYRERSEYQSFTKRGKPLDRAIGIAYTERERRPGQEAVTPV
jgi:hypothetical protein